MREISLARNIWDLLKPLEPNTDTISVERHITPQFQLLPPKVDTGMPFHSGYGNILSNQRPIDAESSSSPHGHSGFSSMPERSRSLPQALASPTSPGGFRQRLDTPQTEFSLEDFTSSDGASYFNAPQTGEASQNPPSYGGDVPLSPEMSLNARATNQSRLPSASTVSFDPNSSLTRSRTVPIVSPIERGMSKWRSKLSTSRKETKTSGDSSSLSSTTLEAQKLEEISLKSLITASKGSRGKGAKSVHVGLSQNSTYALFWTQASINIWDYSTSSAILGRTVLTESNCVLAAVTKSYLAYIIGTRDQKLTVGVHASHLCLYLLIVALAPHRRPHSDITASNGISNAIITMVSQHMYKPKRKLHSRRVRRCSSPFLQPFEIRGTTRRSIAQVPQGLQTMSTS